MRAWTRTVFRGLFLVCCIASGLIVVLPLPSPLWYRAAFSPVFVLIGVMALLLTRVLRPDLLAPRRIPLTLTITPAGIEAKFQDSPPSSYHWDDPSLMLTIFEAKHPGRNPMRWLYLNDDRMNQGIRVDITVCNALSQAATQHQFAKTVSVQDAKFPTRQLIWTTFTHSRRGGPRSLPRGAST
jgi:hypothetical protein